MTDNKDKKPATVANDSDQPDAFEPENMDQTDFFDNSSLSFGEKEVFPQVDFSASKDSPTSATGTSATAAKKSFITKPMMVVFVVLIIMIIVLMILLLVINGQAPAPSSTALQNVDETQTLLKNIDDQIILVDQLNRNFVIPQTNPINLPQL